MLKTAALIFFLLTSIALGGLFVLQSRQTNQRHVEIVGLNEKISHQDQEIEKLKAASADLEQKRAQLAVRNKAAKQARLDAEIAAIPTPNVTDASSPAPKSDGAKDAIKTAETVDPDAKLKVSLGDNLYKQYKNYEKTIPGRLTVSQFQQQLASSNTPTLQPTQSATLLQMITEESVNMPSGGYGQMTGANGKSFAIDTAQVDQFIKAQGELNDRIDTRMAGTISAEQL